MNRFERFLLIKKHPFTGRAFAKLKKKDLAFCEEFIKAREHLSDNEFYYDVNRIGLIHGREIIGLNRDLCWAMMTEIPKNNFKKGKKDE